MEPVGIGVDIHRYRVLFADGEVQDFLAARDDSNVRGEMLNAHYPKPATKDPGPTNKKTTNGQGIMGIVDMGVEYEHHPGQERLDV